MARLLVLGLVVASADAFWSVTQGSSHCVLEEQGRCLSSLSYSNNERCTAVAKANFSIVVWKYGVGERHDYLAVNFNGTGKFQRFRRDEYPRGPDSVRVQPGDELSWRSDGSISFEGWKVCADYGYGNWTGESSWCELPPNDSFMIIMCVFAPILGCLVCNFMVSVSRGSGPPRMTKEQTRYYRSMCPIFDCLLDMVVCVAESIVGSCRRRCCTSSARVEDARAGTPSA
jgi:hypothetical protein